MFLIYRVLIILFVFLLGGLGVQAQEIVAPADSLAQTDSLLVAPTDSTTLAGDSIPEKQTGLDAPVSYQATDSIVMTAGNWAYLYGEGDVKYQNIELQSELCSLSLDSTLSGRSLAIRCLRRAISSMSRRRCGIILVPRKDISRT